MDSIPQFVTSAKISLLITTTCSWCFGQAFTDFGVEQDKLVYHSAMDSEASVEGWIMEGPGQVEFKDGWLGYECFPSKF